MAEKILSEESDSSESKELRRGHFSGEVRDKQPSQSSSRKRQSTQGNKSHKARRRKVKAASSSDNNDSNGRGGCDVKGKQPSQPSSRKRQSTQGNKSHKDKKKKTDYSKILASSIVEKFGKEKLIKTCKKLIRKNTAGIPLLEARNLIDSDCRERIEAKLKEGETFLAATVLVEFLADNHDGNKMEEFCVFVKDQAGESAPRLLNFAGELRECIIYIASARGERKGQVSTTNDSDDSIEDERPLYSPPATQDKPASPVSTEDGKSQKIKEIVAMYRSNEEVHLPDIPELEDDFIEVMTTMGEKLSSADPKMVDQICTKVRLKYRFYIHGVTIAPLVDISKTSDGLYDFIANNSTPFEVLLLHQTVECLQCEDLNADLKEYEEKLAKHLESTLLSWKKKKVILPSRKDHTRLAIVLRSKPDLVLLSLVLHIKRYLVKMLQLDEALFEGFAEDCTILFFSILTTDAVLLSPKVISHLSELKRKFEITHLVVFGYFACDLEQGSVDILVSVKRCAV